MNPRRIPSFWPFLLATCLSLSAFAQFLPPPPMPGAPPTPPPPPTTGEVPTPEIAVTHPPAAPLPPLSPAERDPFWPIGYRPASKSPPSASFPAKTHPPYPAVPELSSTPIRWNEARELLRIGGYFRIGNHYSAYINNRIVSAGELVSVRLEDREYRWRVEAIEANTVRLRPFDSRIVEDSPSPNNPEGSK